MDEPESPSSPSKVTPSLPAGDGEASTKAVVKRARTRSERRRDSLLNAALLTQVREGKSGPGEGLMDGSAHDQDGTVYKDIVGSSTDSFYFRVTAKLCDPNAREYTSYLATFVDVVVAIASLFLQCLVFNSAWIMQVLESTWGCGVADSPCETAYPQGPPTPANIFYMLDEERNKVAYFYVPMMLFCIVAILAEAKGEIDESRAGFILVHKKWRALLSAVAPRLMPDGDSVSTPPANDADGICRLVLATLIVFGRIVLLNEFFQNALLVLGTADGSFDMVLNSVAMIFVLEFDNYIQYDLPDQNNFYKRVSEAEIKRHKKLWQDAKKVFEHAVDVTNTRTQQVVDAYRHFSSFCMMVIGGFIVYGALKMQYKATSKSRFVRSKAWREQSSITESAGYDESFYRALPGHIINPPFGFPIYSALLLLDHHATYRCGSHAYLWRQVLIFLVESVACGIAERGADMLCFSPLFKWRGLGKPSVPG